MKQPQPGQFMTESEEDDVQSLIKVLVPLAVLDEVAFLFFLPSFALQVYLKLFLRSVD